MGVSDHDLIVRCQRGDGEAFAQIVGRWDRTVLSVAYRMVGDTEEAKDIRQAAFLRVYGALPTFNGKARFSTWLYRIVLNLSRDSLRARGARQRGLVREHDRMRCEPGAAPAADQAAGAHELAARVADAVAALPDAEREVVVLRHYEGLRFDEIAEILGTPTSTAKSRMHRALRRLREQLEGVEL